MRAVQAAGVVLGDALTTDARPVRRARVTVAGPVTTTGLTGLDGSFAVRNLPAGRYTLTIQKSGLVQQEDLIVDVQAAAGTRPVRVVMLPGAVITGSVVDRKGIAVAGVAVTLLQGATAAGRLQTDDRGAFRFHSLRAGTYQLSVPPVLYYRHATDMADAEPLTVRTGETIVANMWLDAEASSLAPAPPRPSAIQQSSGTPATAALDGRVVSADHGVALAGIVVHLLYRDVQLSAVTDAAGRFRFAGLPAGQYSVLTQSGRGHVGSYDQLVTRQFAFPASVTLAEAQRVRDFEVRMMAAAALTGRVTDEFGDPAPDVEVVAARRMAVFGRVRITPAPGTATARTDDLGEFRLVGLAPGDYIPLALPSMYATNRRPAGPADSAGAESGFAPTFYPGTSQPADARSVMLAAGANPAIGFALTPAPVARLTGRVIDRQGAPVRASLTLMPRHGEFVQIAIVSMALTNDDGSFSLNAPLGDYVIQAETKDAFGWLNVVAADAARLVHEIVVEPMSRFQGRIVLEGPDDRRVLGNVRLGFRIVDLATSPVHQRAPVQEQTADGTFAAFAIRGVYELMVHAPWPWQVVRVSHRGREITHDWIDSRGGDVDDAEIVLAPKATRVVVTVAGGEVGGRGRAVVVLVPEDQRHLGRSAFTRIGQAGADGVATFEFLPPGSYRAIALADRPPAELMAAEFLLTLAGKGERFVVGWGDSVAVTARPIR